MADIRLICDKLGFLVQSHDLERACQQATSTSSRPTRGRPPKMQPDRVLEIAMNAYWGDDPRNISVNTICQLAKVSKPSLYRRFGNEDGLMLATLDRYASQVMTEFLKILSDNHDLKNLLNRLIDFVCYEPRLMNGCLFQKMCYGERDLGPKTQARLGQLRVLASEAYVSCLHPHFEQTNWPKDVSLQQGAYYLGEQLALAAHLRSLGTSADQVKQLISISLSIFNPTLLHDLKP